MKTTTDQLFAKARQMVAQCPSPTTLGAQLAKLARRRKRTRANIAQERAKAPAAYWWNQLD